MSNHQILVTIVGLIIFVIILWCIREYRRRATITSVGFELSLSGPVVPTRRTRHERLAEITAKRGEVPQMIGDDPLRGWDEGPTPVDSKSEGAMEEGEDDLAFIMSYFVTQNQLDKILREWSSDLIGQHSFFVERLKLLWGRSGSVKTLGMYNDVLRGQYTRLARLVEFAESQGMDTSAAGTKWRNCNLKTQFKKADPRGEIPPLPVSYRGEPESSAPPQTENMPPTKE